MNAQNPDMPLYSIGTAARILGISVQLIRKYEADGLLLPFKTEGNQRLYSPNDIERIECIRRAINENKISIAGIRRIHAMIPCWQLVQCSEEERNGCPAYHEHDGGCWTHKKVSETCVTRECRLCPVYKMSDDCSKIKKHIVEIYHAAT
ncbi:MAG: MerR family transcriptional regulator [Bacteroidetes bacterium]|nr:MerR family transcriptional regulator [Bacteroidota bacterium]